MTFVGYVYLIFDNEKSIKLLIAHCISDLSKGQAGQTTGEYFIRVTSKRTRGKEVQVIPWVITDSTYSKTQNAKSEPARTVFVGALHGMLNAEALFNIMNDLFGGVVFAGIDTDKYKYPIGWFSLFLHGLSFLSQHYFCDSMSIETVKEFSRRICSLSEYILRNGPI